MDICEFRKTVDESNRACEMALRYATLILVDFRELTPEGRRMMADKLMDLISGDGERMIH